MKFAALPQPEGNRLVAAYFASDVHLRLDCPARARRFARFVGALEPKVDTLTIVGDLCDFWFGARQLGADPMECEGLRALAEFRSRGGPVTILLGNHDSSLGPFYSTLGLTLRVEPLEMSVHGLRVHLVHGHRLKPRRGWKAWMEGPSFLRLFQALPDPLASVLDRVLQSSNERSRQRVEQRYYHSFRKYTTTCRGAADLVLIGHVHTPLDAAESNPRLIVPGGWHAQSSYVKVDNTGAVLVVETDDALVSR